MFYTGNPNSTGDTGSIENKAGGAITSECLKGPCWFHVGCEKEVPKNCPCMYVGHYCGVYVWVDAEGREGLSRLTLAILDYATHDPPIKITKQVMYNIDELGLPTTKNQGVATVTATIGVDENPASLLNLNPADEVRIEDKLKHRLMDIESRISGHDATVRAETDGRRDKSPAIRRRANRTPDSISSTSNYEPRPEATILPRHRNALDGNHQPARAATSPTNTNADTMSPAATSGSNALSRVPLASAVCQCESPSRHIFRPCVPRHVCLTVRERTFFMPGLMAGPATR